MTKTELKAHLMAGGTLDQALEFGPGEECEIFKAKAFVPGESILYIPETTLNCIPIVTPMTGEAAIDKVLNFCYTGNDFLEACDGNLELAERLFWSCTWQHPTSCLDCMDDDLNAEAC